MQPLNGFVMLKKMPKIEETKSGIVLPENSTEKESIKSTGYKVMDIAEDVTNVVKGDIVYVDRYAEGAEVNGMVFCKASSLVCKE